MAVSDAWWIGSDNRVTIALLNPFDTLLDTTPPIEVQEAA
jgi:hypothetical protein